MLVVEPAPAADDLGPAQAARCGNLARGRRAAELDEEAVGPCPQGEIVLVDRAILADLGDGVYDAGPASR